MRTKALLIGLDGATFDILDPLMAGGVMPFLRTFVDGGVRASLRTILPPLTPPAWTSLATGRTPGQHGVFDFFQREEPESLYFHLATSRDVQSDTIWSLASAAGKRVIVLNYPVTFPPPQVQGFLVSGGWIPWRQMRLSCHPPGLFDRLRLLPSFNARELAMDAALEEKALEGCAREEFADWIAFHRRREERWFEILKHLMANEEADLVAIVFDGVDKLQHLCWRFLDPNCRPSQPTSWEQQITALCEAYFGDVDRMLAEMVELAGEEATTVVVSDHGFGPSRQVFFVNTWLEQQGYLAWSDPNSEHAVGEPQLGFRHMMRHVNELDWERTVAYAATPSSQGIYIVTRRPGATTSMPEKDYRRIRDEIAARLREVISPVDGRPVVTDVWSRGDGFAGPCEAFAPDLTLELADGGVMSITRSDSILAVRPEPQGSHRWEGIFLGRGPTLRQGQRLDELSILDVAPLLLHCLGLPVPADIRGRLPVQALWEVASQQEDAPLSAGVTAQPGPQETLPTSEYEYDAEAEAAVLERLRSLGYVE